MLTDDQLADRIGPRLRRELADIAAPDDLPARLRRRQASHTRRSVAAGAAATVIAAGVGTLAITASGPKAPAPTHAALTAWTVTTRPDGAVRVLIRDARDPAGLERRLRAAGIPANVTLGNRLSPECKLARNGHGAADAVAFSLNAIKGGVVFTIRRSDIPLGDGVALSFGSLSGGPRLRQTPVISYDYVLLGKQCTGS